jgi:hypothetical protein
MEPHQRASIGHPDSRWEREPELALKESTAPADDSLVKNGRRLQHAEARFAPAFAVGVERQPRGARICAAIIG